MRLRLKRLLKGLAELQSTPDIAIMEVFSVLKEIAVVSMQELDSERSQWPIATCCFKVVTKMDVPPNSIVLTSRMVLAVKDVGTE